MTEAGRPALLALLAIHARCRQRAGEDAAVDAKFEPHLFPSRWREPFGLSVIEAFAAGTAVLAIYNDVIAARARLPGPAPAA